MSKQCRKIGSVLLGAALYVALLSEVFAGQQLQHIKDAGVIRVGFDGVHPPFCFYDADRNMTGFEVELSNALAKELGVKPVLVFAKWDSMPAFIKGNMPASLKHKRLDIVISQAIINEENKSLFDFSEPYLIVGMQALTLKHHQGVINTVANLSGKKVGVGRYTGEIEWLERHAPQAIMTVYDDDDRVEYQDLRAGRLDALLEDRLSALELINGPTIAHEAHSGRRSMIDHPEDFAISDEPLSRQPMGVALRHGEPELRAAVNSAIDKLRADGTLKNLSLKYFNSDITR